MRERESEKVERERQRERERGREGKRERERERERRELEASSAKPKAYPGQATPGFCQDYVPYAAHILAVLGRVWHFSWQHPGVA